MTSAAQQSEWEPGPVVAWTESDGPGRLPPVAPRRVSVAAAIAAGVAGWGFITANDVCPGHSLLIEFAGTIAIVLTFVGVVAAIRSSAAAAPVILAASVCGLSIGVVDALHDVTRSRLVATGFAIAAVAAAFSAVASVRMAQWERSTVAEAEQPLDARLFQAPVVEHHDSEIASPEVPQPSDQH
ncbi:MAG TPA: hypothetical protein VHQ23_10085 [Ilumatobacteraceae bacterium]|nr:hypothetical protein [Ilumatobacteraceae bacterium]